MRILTLIIIAIFMTGCFIFKNTPDELVASKCRLKIPVHKEECIRVGVFGTKGGQLAGLPVTEGGL